MSWVGIMQYKAKQKMNEDQNLKDSFDEFKQDFTTNQNKFSELIQNIEKVKNDQLNTTALLKNSLDTSINMLTYRIELLQKEKDMLVEQFKKDIDSTKEGNRQLLDTFNELKNQITSKLDQLLKEHYMCINKNETASN